MIGFFEAGDVDGDGDLDLILAGFEGVFVLLGDGVGGFSPGELFAPGSHKVPLLHDLDLDGDLDLVFLRKSKGDAVETYIGGGDGTFAAGQSLDFDGSLLDLGILAPAKGARPSVLVTTYTSMIGYRLYALDVDEGGLLGDFAVVPEIGGKTLALGGFDGAPRPDVLTFGAEIVALLGQEPWPAAAPIAVGEADPLQGNLAVGDVNEDGIDDVVFSEGDVPLRLLRSAP